MLLLTILGWLDTGQPFFLQKRVGRNRRIFTLIKFRTMRPGTPCQATHQVDAQSITRYGRFLRRRKLDEIPQFLNVLAGDMGLVGPRPCLPIQSEVITARDSLGVFEVRPGITGLAQVSGIDMSEPDKLAAWDSRMIREFHLGRYFLYLLQTLLGLVRA